MIGTLVAVAVFFIYIVGWYNGVKQGKTEIKNKVLRNDGKLPGKSMV